MQRTLPNLFGPSKTVSLMRKKVTVHDYAKLLTKWEWPPEDRDLLEVYVLYDYPASRLHNQLRNGRGILRLNEQAYVPVYSNTSRKDITQQTHKEFLVSYRLPKHAEYGIALIQPKLN